MNCKTIARSVSVLTAMMLIPMTLPAAESQAQIELEKEGIELINQVEGVSRDIRYNASILNQGAMAMHVSKWVHIHHLAQIRDLVNEGLRPALIRLQEIQPQLPDWKQKSVDKMLESAATLAADANSAILNKRESGAMPAALNLEYRQQLATVYTHADALVKAADVAGNYARARLKAAESGLISKK